MAEEPSPIVRCKDCALASFQRAANGRLLRKAGRCQAQFPVVQVICLPQGKGEYPPKNAIWPDFEGVCDFYQAASAAKRPEAV